MALRVVALWLLSVTVLACNGSIDLRRESSARDGAGGAVVPDQRDANGAGGMGGTPTGNPGDGSAAEGAVGANELDARSSRSDSSDGDGSRANPPVTTACAAGDPFLKTNAKTIRNGRGQGDVVALRGANFGGWLMLETWMTPMDNVPDDYTMRQVLSDRFGATQRDALIATYENAWSQTADFDNLAALGMNVIRIPFAYPNLLNPDGSPRSDAFARLDWAVQEAWKRCLYVILDLHGAPGSQNGWASGGLIGPSNLWTSADNQLRTIALWEMIARHYVGNPAIAGYDLLNEPAGAATDQERWQMQDRIHKAIRVIDPDHITFIEAIWWLDNLPVPSAFGWTNVVYECHHYDWDHQTDAAILKSGADAKVNDWAAHANFNVPFFLGEFNFFGVAEAWKYGIEQFDKNGIGWTTWSWRATADGGGLQNSWGVYNPIDPRPARPNIANDAANDIQTKWSSWTIGAFGLNPMLKSALAMPVIVRDEYQTNAGQALQVPSPGILANDRDVNVGGPGISLSVRKAADPVHGTVTLNADGSFNYMPESGFRGTDTFRYTAFDGRVDSAAPGIVTITVR